MKVGFILNESETSDDINNFTLANAIFKECKIYPELNAKVIAEMLLLQYNKEHEKRQV